MDANIKQNLLTGLLYSKAQKNSKGQVDVRNNANQELKKLDINNDGFVSENEKSFFDANNDNKISTNDLGIYTAFISFSEKYVANKSTTIANDAYDINQDGTIDEEERKLQSVFDTNNDGKIDTDVVDLIKKAKNLSGNFVELLEKEKNTLNNKINPDNNRHNRVFNTKTGQLLSQIYTEEKNGKSTDYSIEYKYHSNGALSEKTVVNQTNGNKTVSKFNKEGIETEQTTYKYKNGNLAETIICTYDENGQLKTKTTKEGNKEYTYTYHSFDSKGNVTKLTLTENGVNTDYTYSYKYFPDSDVYERRTIENKTTGKKTVYTFDENGTETSKTVYTYKDNGDMATKTVTEGDRTYKYIYNKFDKNGKVTDLTLVENGTKTHYTYSYKYHPDGRTLKEKTIKNEDTKKETIHYYNKNGEETGKQITAFEYDENNTQIKKTVSKYDENGQITEKETTEGTRVYTYIYHEFDSNGKVTKLTSIENGKETNYSYSYKYHSDNTTLKEKIILNEDNGKTTVNKYDVNGKLTEKSVKEYKTNGKLKSETYYKYDTNGFTTQKVVKKGDNTYTYNYSNFDETGYPAKYTVEYDSNGAHVYSEITQRKAGNQDYIVSAKNYQIIGNKKVLTSTLNTTTKTNANGVEQEGTERVFYFYDENGNKIKEEKTFSFNKEQTNPNEPVSTNNLFQINQKEIINYDPITGEETSVITFRNNKIQITYANGSSEEMDYDEYSKNHAPEDFDRDKFIEEAKKYIGFNRLDGSYSIFGTNGSACASYATFLMYQFGFDLNTVKTRTTHGLQTRAKAEGRYKEAKDVFASLEDGQKINNLIKPGDLWTQMLPNGSSSHTTIVTGATYEAKEDGTYEILVNVLGYESNTTSKGVYEQTYKLVGVKQPDGTYKVSLYNGLDDTTPKEDSEYKLGFCDFISDIDDVVTL